MKLHGKAKQEFLRRMEAGRRKHRRPAKRAKRAKPAKHRHHPKHHHEAPPMATKRRRSTTTHKKKHKRRHGHSGGRVKSLVRGLVPTVDEAISAGAAGAYGFLEGAAAKDQAHFLRKVPVPIASIGRCGTIGVGLWLIGAVAKRRFLRSMARGVVDVAAYQLLRRPSPFGKAGDKDTEFTLGAYGGGGSCAVDRRTPMIVDRHLQVLDTDDDTDNDNDSDDDTD